MDKLTPEQQVAFATVDRDITYPSFNGTLQPTDDTLASRGQGKGLKLYDEVERDCTVGSALDKRILAVVSRPWQVDPASSSAIDKKAADFVRGQLAKINFDHVCINLLDAILKGFAVAEVIPAIRGDNVVIGQIIARDQRRFTFSDENQLRLLTFDAPLAGVAVPDRKFIVHSFGSKIDNPFGVGLGRRLFWPAFFKRQDIKFWLTFADKFVNPTPVGKYAPGTSKELQDMLLESLKSIGQETAIIMPDDMAVAFLEALRSGGSDFYEKIVRYFDEQINLTVLLDANGGQSSGGAIASSAILRNEVRLELVQADADLLSETLNNTLAAWLTAWNFPNATPPKIWRVVEETKNTKENADRDKVICDMGFEPDEQYIKETYGQGWRKKAKSVGDSGTASFAEPQPASAIVQQSAALANESAGALKTLVDGVEAIFASAVSYEDLRDKLLASFADLDSEALQKVMTLGFACADLSGRFDVQEGR